MGYVSIEQARKMPRQALVREFIETQTMAAAAISEALTLGGHKAEVAILAKYEARLPSELRVPV